MEKFEYFNPNPDASTFKSGKPKYWGKKDDGIRALCKAYDKTWHEMYDELCTYAKKHNDIAQSKTVINDYLTSNGYEFITLGKPAPGIKRPIIKDFLIDNPVGTYVLYLRDYYVTVEDGVLYNVIDNQDEPIYSYWKLTK